jgi:hypothetical protein
MQLLARREALVRIFGQAAAEYLVDRGRDVMPQLAERCRVVAQNRRNRVEIRLAGKRSLPGKHLVQHHPEREDVGAGVDRPALHLLG